MKKLAIILAVLIVLVTLIGFERIGRGLRFLVSDERVAKARENGQAAKTEATKAKAPSTGESQSFRTDPRFDDHGSGDTISSAPIDEHSSPQSVAVRIIGEISPMHFIRASTIIGHSEPTKEQIDRLREALAVIGDALRPSAVIFDADGFSTSEAPVLLYVRNEFDLTDQVKAVYDQLEKSSNHPAEESKVEPQR
jgi:hypothetical protein